MSNFTEDPILNLYKLEYDNGNLRYNNIYQAMWTNFSYMAIVAGGILTFGKDSQLSIIFLCEISCLPLIFWFWVSYIPLNKYGNAVSRRLREIEEDLNKIAFASAQHANSPDPISYKRKKHREGLHLYSDFENRKEGKRLCFVRFIEDKLRVRHSIWIFSTCLHILFVFLLILWGIDGFRVQMPPKPDQTSQEKVMEQKVDEMSRDLDEIKYGLRELKNSADELKSRTEKTAEKDGKDGQEN